MAGPTRTVHRGAKPISPVYHEEITKGVADLEALRAAMFPSKVFEGNPLLSSDDTTTTKCEAYGTSRIAIAGKAYTIPPTAAILLPGTDDITADKFGAWRFEVTALGAWTATPAIGVGSDQAFESADLAMAALAIIDRTAGAVEEGILVIEAGGSGFTVGTDVPNTSDANVVAATYYNMIGDHVVEVAATLAASATPEQVAVGAYTVRRNGLLLAEVAAQATLAFALADTVTTLKFGAWVFFTDLAGTATYIQSVDGDTTASLMAYATAAAAQAAIDAFLLLLPDYLVPVGQLIIEVGAKDPWTAITDSLTDDVTSATFSAIAAGTNADSTVMDAAADLTMGVISDN